MSPNEAQEAFLREGNVAVLATVDRRGRAHAAPIWYIYADGVFVMSTGRGSQKHRNIDALVQWFAGNLHCHCDWDKHQLYDKDRDCCMQLNSCWQLSSYSNRY